MPLPPGELAGVHFILACEPKVSIVYALIKKRSFFFNRKRIVEQRKNTSIIFPELAARDDGRMVDCLNRIIEDDHVRTVAGRFAEGNS